MVYSLSIKNDEDFDKGLLIEPESHTYLLAVGTTLEVRISKLIDRKTIGIEIEEKNRLVVLYADSFSEEQVFRDGKMLAPEFDLVPEDWF